MSPALREAVARALGEPVVSASRAAGGDINEAWVLRTPGRRVFLKARPGGGDGWFRVEAAGLRWLGEPGALPVPEVLALSAPGAETPWMALSFIPPGRGSAAADESFGRSLAALHRSGAPGFGLDHDNLIGALPQDNTPEADWATFWAQRRLLPQLERAGERLPAAVRRRVARVIDRVPALVGPPEPPARLHGDLWGGNRLVDDPGRSWLIDPAAYGGHREVDLAMMRLFGGFSGRCFDAYAEAWPLAAGHEARIPLYQLYYLLVHVNLFGRGWVSGVEGAVSALGG
ncbi:MAG: fructosamine kinase family protein [Alphaproteobacteria bacterium]|nr:fructosamine kinase family protein [Alphaproteobacteria bacterium]